MLFFKTLFLYYLIFMGHSPQFAPLMEALVHGNNIVLCCWRVEAILGR